MQLDCEFSVSRSLTPWGFPLFRFECKVSGRQCWRNRGLGRFAPFGDRFWLSWMLIRGRLSFCVVSSFILRVKQYPLSAKKAHLMIQFQMSGTNMLPN